MPLSLLSPTGACSSETGKFRWIVSNFEKKSNFLMVKKNFGQALQCTPFITVLAGSERTASGGQLCSAFLTCSHRNLPMQMRWRGYLPSCLLMIHQVSLLSILSVLTCVIVLCYAVLCCAVLCCAVLCCAHVYVQTLTLSETCCRILVSCQSLVGWSTHHGLQLQGLRWNAVLLPLRKQ